MLKLLQIENIAVIEKAEIEFNCGLNVLTGETGAGKSIVIDSLSAVTGGRVSRDIVRTGAVKASVVAVFSDIGDLSWFDENGVDADESGEVFLSRKIASDGKGDCRVNGTPVSVTQLRELGARLLDIHGQNDGRKLLDENAHLSYLDIFGGLEKKRDEYRISYVKLNKIVDEIKALTLDEREKERRIETLKQQVEEIEKAKIKPGERDELSSRRELLLNASKLTDAVETAFESLYGGERSEGAAALIINAFNNLDNAARYSDGFLSGLCERLNDLRYGVQDAADELRDFRAKLEFSPGEFDELEARLDTLKRIERKYGGEAEALNALEQWKEELSGIEDSENRILKLEKELNICDNEARTLASELSEARKQAARALQERVKQELSQLSMPGVYFVVEFGETRSVNGLNSNGSDEVCFLMSANAGEKPGRINRIASGGELARIMLALKNVITSGLDTGTMVFDEVDTGVSGIAAQRVGEKLARLAANRQVLCVTHLPQIAVMADTHFEIEKSISMGRTYTKVAELDFEGRKQEIARLSGGENITETTINSAAEQLSAAKEFKQSKR
jgi:DNA repair protein RecN (Recombination protein N)